MIHRGRHLAALGFALGAMALSGCNQDPLKAPPKFRLEGSLGQVMDLGYDEARVLLAPSDVSLLLVRCRSPHPADPCNPPAGVSEDYPLKVAFRLLDEAIGKTMDLASLDLNGVQRGSLSRNVTDDPRNTLPPILRGELSFDRPLDPGTVVGGNFHVTFENGVEAASGRTVFSKSFSAKVQP